MAETAQLIATCKHWPAPTALAHCTTILPAGADEETKAKMAQRQRLHADTQRPGPVVPGEVTVWCLGWGSPHPGEEPGGGPGW